MKQLRVIVTAFLFLELIHYYPLGKTVGISGGTPIAPQRHRQGSHMIRNQPAGIGKVFSIIALLEGLTWAGLLIGMFLKYTTKTTELAVTLFGPLHGIVFISYVVVTVMAAVRLRWPLWATLLAMLAAVPPLVTIPMEIWFKRRGLLSDRAARQAAVA
jgi:integral membrane protein